MAIQMIEHIIVAYISLTDVKNQLIQGVLKMGMFSWETQDTDRSIANVHSKRETFTVYLKDHRGNFWREDKYQGYGIFGGKDYYELLAEMNGLEHRDEGITLVYGLTKEKSIKWPTLTEDLHFNAEGPPKDCPYQGFFYEDKQYLVNRLF